MPLPVEPFSVEAFLANPDGPADLQVRLYQGTVNPAVPHVAVDFQEANFPGYAPQPFVPQTPRRIVTGLGTLCKSEMTVWGHTGSGNQVNLLGGYYLVAVYADGSVALVAWEKFAAAFVCGPTSLPFGLIVYLRAERIVV